MFPQLVKNHLDENLKNRLLRNQLTLKGSTLEVNKFRGQKSRQLFNLHNGNATMFHYPLRDGSEYR